MNTQELANAFTDMCAKGELEAAAFGDHPVAGAAGQTAACQGIIAAAGTLAKHL